MSDYLKSPPRFEIIPFKTPVYEKYSAYFKFLEKLFWTIDCLVLNTNKNLDVPRHQLTARLFLFWLYRQNWAIILLLKDSFVSQAKQLIRGLWEVKISLLYIAKAPKERLEEFYGKTLQDLNAFQKQAKEGNNLSPFELKDLPSFPLPESVWEDKVYNRVVDVELENEYRTIYKSLSQQAHISASALLQLMKSELGSNYFDFTVAAEMVPGSLMVASDITVGVFKEINKVLQMLTDGEINAIDNELENLWKLFNVEHKKDIEDLLILWKQLYEQKIQG